MGMAGLSEDFITLTQLNCVQQCSALIYDPKPRNYLTAAALFGLYCGVLIYRSYRNHQAKVQARREVVLTTVPEEVPIYDEYTFEAPTVVRPEHPIEPTIVETRLIERHSEETLPAVP